MSLVHKVVWQIESALGEELSLELIAQRSAVSLHHMCRAFRLASGWSVMGYLRARRLSEAAKILAQSKQDILSVALDTGYGSHEAFSRAFQNQFGIAPHLARKPDLFANLTLTEPLKMNYAMIVDVAPPRIESLGPLSVIGLSTRCQLPEIGDIPAHWKRFASKLYAHEPEFSGTTYGVSYGHDGNGGFTYMSAREGKTPPPGFEKLDIAPARYAVFTHDGHISEFPKMVHTVWDKALSDAGLEPASAPDIEIYDSRFDAQTGRGVVELWIPLK